MIRLYSLPGLYSHPPHTVSIIAGVATSNGNLVVDRESFKWYCKNKPRGIAVPGCARAFFKCDFLFWERRHEVCGRVNSPVNRQTDLLRKVKFPAARYSMSVAIVNHDITDRSYFSRWDVIKPCLTKHYLHAYPGSDISIQYVHQGFTVCTYCIYQEGIVLEKKSWGTHHFHTDISFPFTRIGHYLVLLVKA